MVITYTKKTIIKSHCGICFAVLLANSYPSRNFPDSVVPRFYCEKNHFLFFSKYFI